MRFMAIGLVIVLLAMPANAQTETRPAQVPAEEAAVAAEGGISTGAIIGIAAATAFIVVDGWYGFPLLRGLHGYVYRLIYPPPPPPSPTVTMQSMGVVAGAISGIMVRAYHSVAGQPTAEPAGPVDINTAVQG